MPPLVSVLIPIYNVAPYLREAVESILKQSYQHLEIIMINDGSTDGSFEIAKEFQLDNRVQLYTQENKGKSAALHKGFEIATGKYFYLFDSDDILEKNAIEDCIRMMEQDDLDILGFSSESFCDEDIDFKFKVDRYQREDTPLLSGKEFIEKYLLTKTYMVSVCHYIAKKSIVDENGIKFIDRIPHQDETFTFDLFFHAKNVRAIKDKYYKRRYRADSIMTKKKSTVNAVALLKVNAHFEKNYANYGPGKQYIKKLHRRISQLIMKHNLPYSVMDDFDFSIPLKYRIKYLPKRFKTKLR